MNLPSSDLSNLTEVTSIDLLRSLNCLPKPYPGVQGLKKWIVSLILLVFLLCGLVGNILSATIMFRRARRGLSSYFYLALLAIADICVLYSGGLLSLFDIAFNYSPESQSTIYCRLASYIRHLFTYLSAWLIVAVTIERFIVVRFPLQSIYICRLHVAYGITLFILLFFSTYTAHCFFTMDIEHISLQTDDGYHPDFKSCDLAKYRHVLSSIDLCFYSVIPSLLIIIFNILIILTMYYAIKQRRNYLQANSCLPTTDTSQGKHHQKNKSSSSNRSPFFRSRSGESTPVGHGFMPHGQLCHVRSSKTGFQNKSQRVLFDSTNATGMRLTLSLLIISFVFVLCTFPISIRSLIIDIFPGQNKKSHWQIAQLCLTILMYFNHAVNFVLYCLTGRAFRRDCRKLLGDLWRLKDIHISCIINPNVDKHHQYHQQMTVISRNCLNIPHKQQHQRIQRSYL
ncbi:unnamed protein product [Rotaria magnacalcarata]|uniref:G-protein coupled receptors family 1 profile domain-containing protein n=1 Tax=Rotaria magnacalcarata TaxID=392030 RepID=A0A819TPK4_9BILA|nr:unnamed protein product [Rotaria magnacalcarata]CAF1301142.1 unnamed protein product [Rotaria magnacalcarata]CAF2055115.1 unnamed protein product [Rotaria magnacalcarata]CAF2100893.1 unnamed protein product [Rotaria magnacalcarata]CAF2141325.1 unnamed protein product [Rotaria magnacalcarata]